MVWWKRKKRITVPTDAPDFIHNYIEKRYLPATPNAFLVVDLETTGLNPKSDRILSFGAVPVTENTIELGRMLEGTLYNPDASESIKASEIHHLTQSDIVDGCLPESFARALLERLEQRVFVGHHVTFDVECLNQFFRKRYGIELYNNTLDTAQLAARLNNPHGKDPTFKLGLDDVCEQYGIDPALRHTAGGDAFTTALLFIKLLKHARQRRIRVVQ